MEAMRRPVALAAALLAVLISNLCHGSEAVAQTIVPRVPPPGEAAYRLALYPRGLPRRENVLSHSMMQTAFSLDAHTALPGTVREVIVFSERIAKNPPGDATYWVFVALVEKTGAAYRVLDRREITQDLKLFTEFPGNFQDMGALVTPLAARAATVAAVEVWTTISGSGGITAGTHFFFVVSPAGTLAPALVLESYNHGRSGPDASAVVANIKVGTSAAVSGDVILATRSAKWNAFDSAASAKCEPAQTTRYRFTGSKYESAAAVPVPAAATFTDLPILLPQKACDN